VLDEEELKKKGLDVELKEETSIEELLVEELLVKELLIEELDEDGLDDELVDEDVHEEQVETVVVAITIDVEVKIVAGATGVTSGWVLVVVDTTVTVEGELFVALQSVGMLWTSVSV
jgi:hypothetical protein